MKRIAAVVSAALAVVAVSTGESSASGRASTAGAVVAVRAVSLGHVLVVGAGRMRGRTLYMFTSDSRTHSRCFGSCASIWRPLVTAAAPRASAGARQSKLSTIPRGRSRQVTYGGHPLYLYSGDSRAGQVHGEGIHSFGGAWWALNSSGRMVKPRSPAPMSPAPTSPAPSPYPYY